ncbi:MAG: chemotaxis response regulator protein-glutamate methylesterase [Nitrospinota bacterium]|nr:chemotaxis response regulator protein-glutamate methylesterase [Nitrospinota bacterium]
MPKIRVLIVDDAVVVRKMLSDTMNQDPDIEVVGVAANGSICLQKIPQVNPDIISLDIEMPEMNGLEALDRIRETWPRLPVIMFSTLTQKGATATLDALSKGATDYVAKPSKATSLDEGIELIKNGLIPKIKALCSERAGLDIPSSLPKPKPIASPPEASKVNKAIKQHHRVDVVTIGVSTGGPNALAELLPSFPKNFPVPIVIVQHMPPNFTKLLADRLDSKANLTVKEARNGDILYPGHVYVAPGDYHMYVEQSKDDVVTRLNQDPHENSCRPAADVLFRSVAKVFGRNSLAVVLTGMGQDGMHGCEHIQARGGQVIAQDEESSVVWGMPGFVVKANLADKILPLKSIADDVILKCQTGRLASMVGDKGK